MNTTTLIHKPIQIQRRKVIKSFLENASSAFITKTNNIKTNTRSLLRTNARSRAYSKTIQERTQNNHDETNHPDHIQTKRAG